MSNFPIAAPPHELPFGGSHQYRPQGLSHRAQLIARIIVVLIVTVPSIFLAYKLYAVATSIGSVYSQAAESVKYPAAIAAKVQQ